MNFVNINLSIHQWLGYQNLYILYICVFNSGALHKRPFNLVEIIFGSHYSLHLGVYSFNELYYLS